MSYLNINYSTLEDAWGKNFEKKQKKNSKDLCNLYNKRHAGIYKPYKTTQDPTFVKPIYSDEDYVKYYGYKDGRPFRKNNKNITKYKVNIPFTKNNLYKEPIITNNYISDEEEDYEEQPVPKKYSMKKNEKCNQPYIRTPFSYIDNDDTTYKQRTTKYPILVEQEDDDDEYGEYNLQEADLENEPPNELQASNPNKHLFEIDYDDDDFDSYFKPSDFNGADIETSFDTKYMKKGCKNNDSVDSEEHDDQYNKMIRSTLRETYTDPIVKDFKKPKINKEKIHLDLALYTISGIVLIFILEQFIQIGMKIKNL